MAMHDDPIDDLSDDIETTALGADTGPEPALEPGAPAEAHLPASNARAAGWDNAAPGWRYTVLIILATATPLLVIFYLGNLLLGLPFLALGAEYPDRNYVSVWIGEHSPIIIYDDLQTALAAFGSDEDPVGLFFIDE